MFLFDGKSKSADPSGYTKILSAIVENGPASKKCVKTVTVQAGKSIVATVNWGPPQLSTKAGQIDERHYYNVSCLKGTVRLMKIEKRYTDKTLRQALFHHRTSPNASKSLLRLER